ncbi:MAG: hypothetical protein HY775_02275 [Acidobacteria bacterium]|nr:hypothetical protein [Acidobacteriota bacterium]
MADLDERLRDSLRRLAEPGDPSGAFGRIRARWKRRRLVKRIEMGVLAGVLVAAGMLGIARLNERTPRIVLGAPTPVPSGSPGRAPSDQPITIEVSVSPREPRAGELVSFHVHAQDPDDGPVTASIDYGDGRSAGLGGPISCPAPIPRSADAPPPSPGPPGETTVVFRRGYRAPGVYEVVIGASSVSPCGGEDDPFASRAEETVRLTIGPPAGRVPTNGPILPTVELAVSPEPTDPPEPLTAGAHYWFKDPDGFARRIEIDWGDGERFVEEKPLGGCEESATQWPESSFNAGFTDVKETFIRQHRYSRAGTFEVSIRLTTTGCDGGDPQTAEAVAEVEVGT